MIGNNCASAELFTHHDLEKIWAEIQDQPPWRLAANREMDYCDGNQLDAKILKKLQERGIPPSIENVLGPLMVEMKGLEAANRKDWLLEPDNPDDPEANDVSMALNYKLNQAERRSGADYACSDAYYHQSGVGLGWVEVSREPNKFKFPYRCKFVHRNEIWWDFTSKEYDLSDAKWLLRRKWTHKEVAKALWPHLADLIEMAANNWAYTDGKRLYADDGDDMTGLYQSFDIERGFSIEEMEWRTPENGRVCLFEVQERRWEVAMVFTTPDGRVKEYDSSKPEHQMVAYAVSAGVPGYTLEESIVSRVYKHIFLGPHRLSSELSEFGTFNYVPFWGKREDRSRVPYGVVRWLMYLQDELNARVSKMQWLLASTRVERTDGAVAMEDEVFRLEVGRPDADIILDREHMAQKGAVFKVDHERDLNAQQYQRVLDIREVVKRIASFSDAVSGKASPDNAGAYNTAVDQSMQALAMINDNFERSRQSVGDLLLSMQIKDMEGKEENIVVKAGPIKKPREITLNKPVIGENGHKYLTNDVTRVKFKVNMTEHPSTQSYREQQLASLAEAFKSSPPQYQAVMMPHLMNLTNIPDKQEIVEAILEINQNSQLTEEAVEARIKEAVDQAMIKAQVDLKMRELDIREKESQAKVEQINVKNVLDRVEAMYSAVQTALQLIQASPAAQSADQILESAGAEDKDAPPLVAGIPGVPVSQQQPVPQVAENTHPLYPPRVQEPATEEIDEARTEELVPAGQGINEGIQEEGVQ